MGELTRTLAPTLPREMESERYPSPQGGAVGGGGLAGYGLDDDAGAQYDSPA